MQGAAELLTGAAPRLAVVALGSNLGPRGEHLRYAIERLADLLSGLRVSTVRETAPVGVPPQGPYLNAVAVGETGAEPVTLLGALLALERTRGRARPFAGAPRTLDLDLILLGDLVVESPSLTLPHPRFRERTFVLEPLVEVAPDVVDPVTGQTARQLLAALTATV